LSDTVVRQVDVLHVPVVSEAPRHGPGTGVANFVALKLHVAESVSVAQE
jgi:hypothetical protein